MESVGIKTCNICNKDFKFCKHTVQQNISVLNITKMEQAQKIDILEQRVNALERVVGEIWTVLPSPHPGSMINT
jgi:hypothetical protein